MVVIFHKKMKDLRNRASKAIFVETRGLLRGFELSLTDRFPFEFLNVTNHRFGQIRSKT